MKYAPIIIPTCNRNEHLERCLDSLVQNGWAKYTDLFISVDFPPSKKYQEGYARVCKYLKSNFDKTHFNNVYIYFQQNNLGEYNNIDFLVGKASKKYDRYIFTEDDNCFSTNFIEYCDKALEFYYQDEEVVSVCGFQTKTKIQTLQNTVLDVCYCAWGSAMWIYEAEKQKEWITVQNITNFAKNAQNMMNLRKNSCGVFNTFVSGMLINHISTFYNEDGSIANIDITKNIYMCANNKYAVYPKSNMVKNYGNDGSGINCKKGDYVGGEITNIDTDFEFSRHESNLIADFQEHPIGLEQWLRNELILFKYLIWLLLIRRLA